MQYRPNIEISMSRRILVVNKKRDTQNKNNFQELDAKFKIWNRKRKEKTVITKVFLTIPSKASQCYAYTHCSLPHNDQNMFHTQQIE